MPQPINKWAHIAPTFYYTKKQFAPICSFIYSFILFITPLTDEYTIYLSLQFQQDLSKHPAFLLNWRDLWHNLCDITK